MEIVIDIPDHLYNVIKNKECTNKNVLTKAVENGTPLPKGHGKLKDTDKFIKRVEEDRTHECYLHSWTADDVLQRLDSWYAPTIIEADKDNEEMTYEDIYEEFCKKFPNAEVEDYRPAVEMYIPQIARGIPNAIIVWLKDGSEIIYIAESRDKR